jgi:hypothetical protein
LPTTVAARAGAGFCGPFGHKAAVDQDAAAVVGLERLDDADAGAGALLAGQLFDEVAGKAARSR